MVTVASVAAKSAVDPLSTLTVAFLASTLSIFSPDPLSTSTAISSAEPEEASADALLLTFIPEIDLTVTSAVDR